jgi:uncharacterized MnhB-related membrane protein
MTMLMPGDTIISTIFIILANPFLNSLFSSSEFGMMILVWVILSSAGIAICALIGSVIWRLFSSMALILMSEQ